MQIIQVADRRVFTTDSGGTLLTTTISEHIIDVLAANVASVYVLAETPSETMDVYVKFEHGPDGLNWKGGGTLATLADLSQGGLYSSDSPFEAMTGMAKIRVTVDVVDDGTPDAFGSVALSIWVVLKPFSLVS